MAQSYSKEALFERAEALVPRLRERAVATNNARSVPAETIEDFWDNDLLYLLKPGKYGGPEVRVLAALAALWGLAPLVGRQFRPPAESP